MYITYNKKGSWKMPIIHLINELPPVGVIVSQNFCPQLHVSSLDEISGLRLEQRILVADRDQLTVALAAFVGYAGEVRVPLFTVASNYLAVVVRVLPGRVNGKKCVFTYPSRLLEIPGVGRYSLKEPFRVVVRVYVDLGERIVRCRLVRSFMNARLKPWQNELEPVPLFYFFDQLVRVELASHHLDQVLDYVL